MNRCMVDGMVKWTIAGVAKIVGIIIAYIAMIYVCYLAHMVYNQLAYAPLLEFYAKCAGGLLCIVIAASVLVMSASEKLRELRDECK